MASTALGDRLERAIRVRARQVASRAAVAMEVELRRNWQPHASPSSETRRTISVREESLTATSITFVARVTTPQSKFVNDGTAAHRITARNAKALRFVWPNAPASIPAARDGYHYFRSVWHPGYRGSGWWDFTIAQWHDLLARSL